VWGLGFLLLVNVFGWWFLHRYEGCLWWSSVLWIRWWEEGVDFCDWFLDSLLFVVSLSGNVRCSCLLTRSAGWLQQLLWPFDLAWETCLLDQETTHLQKTKGRPGVCLHSDAQVSIRAKKHQVCILASVLETAYLTRVLGTLYIGWN